MDGVQVESVLRLITCLSVSSVLIQMYPEGLFLWLIVIHSDYIGTSEGMFLIHIIHALPTDIQRGLPTEKGISV